MMQEVDERSMRRVMKAIKNEALHERSYRHSVEMSLKNYVFSLALNMSLKS